MRAGVGVDASAYIKRCFEVAESYHAVPEGRRGQFPARCRGPGGARGRSGGSSRPRTENNVEKPRSEDQPVIEPQVEETTPKPVAENPEGTS